LFDSVNKKSNENPLIPQYLQNPFELKPRTAT
jgi:hypothetical protein